MYAALRYHLHKRELSFFHEKVKQTPSALLSTDARTNELRENLHAARGDVSEVEPQAGRHVRHITGEFAAHI